MVPRGSKRRLRQVFHDLPARDNLRRYIRSDAVATVGAASDRLG
jgi:hypothetical protein